MIVLLFGSELLGLSDSQYSAFRYYLINAYYFKIYYFEFPNLLSKINPKIEQPIMLISSSSINKNKIETPSCSSTSNILLRSDGFRKLLKGYSTNKQKMQQSQQPIITSQTKLHTSSGFRRHTKEYRLQAQAETDSRNDCSNELLPSSNNINIHSNYRTMTAAKQLNKRGTGTNFYSSTTNFCGVGFKENQMSNDKKTVQFLKMEQQEEQCFKNVCKMLNVVL